jgi:hypothetical protein
MNMRMIAIFCAYLALVTMAALRTIPQTGGIWIRTTTFPTNTITIPQEPCREGELLAVTSMNGPAVCVHPIHDWGGGVLKVAGQPVYGPKDVSEIDSK